jgi:hypothetical protein
MNFIGPIIPTLIVGISGSGGGQATKTGVNISNIATTANITFTFLGIFFTSLFFSHYLIG